MYSTTLYFVFITATTLASLFIHLVKPYPALDKEGTSSLRYIPTTNESENEKTDNDNESVQYKETERYEDTEVVFQKCKRNKRHVHRQKHTHQDATWEEQADASGSTDSNPLTDEEVLDIELQYHIERVKQKILAKLHLNQPPNVTVSKPQIPPQLTRKVLTADGNKDDVGTLDDDAADEYDGKITQIILIAENGTGECDFPDTSLCYRFSNSGTGTSLEITSASIWIYVLPDPDSVKNSSTSQRISITRPAKHYGKRTTLASQLINVSEGWVEINIEHGLHQFAKHEQFIEIGFTRGRSSLSSGASQQPKLELDVTNHVRAARSTRRRRLCQPTSTECCMQSYTINFADIGWDFILEPTEYVANYCRGTCTSSGPFTFDHSQIASLKAQNLRNRNRGRSTSAIAAAVLAADLTPCCAPERLDSLSVMYLDDNNQVTVDLLDDMIVRSCGCA